MEPENNLNRVYQPRPTYHPYFRPVPAAPFLSRPFIRLGYPYLQPNYQPLNYLMSPYSYTRPAHNPGAALRPFHLQFNSQSAGFSEYNKMNCFKMESEEKNELSFEDKLKLSFSDYENGVKPDIEFVDSEKNIVNYNSFKEVLKDQDNREVLIIRNFQIWVIFNYQNITRRGLSFEEFLYQMMKMYVEAMKEQISESFYAWADIYTATIEKFIKNLHFD